MSPGGTGNQESLCFEDQQQFSSEFSQVVVKENYVITSSKNFQFTNF